MSTLSPGRRLGAYEIVSPLAAGGMGEVYRARDTRLGRDVAIKVLPEHLAQNPDLRQRFEREAKAVSSLNHPHICVLHDIGSENGIDYLVLEYLEGETLLERLSKGPLPLSQALRYGAEIADALDKAHRRGVVHRDLKPGNVMLTKGGAKLLDFGLARTAKPVLSADENRSDLDTPSKPLTNKGTLLGTIPYMAPEQIEGREPDGRTDLWAMGCLLYEMVTGKRAFEAPSAASLIGAILKDEPRPIRELKPLSPPSLDRLVGRCLAKDPEERWQNAHDLASELRWIAEEATKDSTTGSPSPAPRAIIRFLPWLLAAAASLTVAWMLSVRPPPDSRAHEVQQFELAFPPDVEPRPDLAGGVVLSPNGKIVAATAVKNGVRSVFVRSLDRADFSELAQLVNGYAFSPDSTRLAVIGANGELAAVSLGDRQREDWSTNADVAASLAWGEAGIVFGRNGALWIAPAGGGEPRALTELDAARHEVLHSGPIVLRGGGTILFTSFTDTGSGRVEAVSVEGGARRVVVEQATTPVWSPTGHLLFERDGAVLATEFDEESLEVRAVATTVLPPGLVGTTQRGTLALQLATNGTLLFVPKGFGAQRIVSVARDGSTVALNVPPRGYESPRLSPDGRRVLVGIDQRYLEAFHLERGARSQLTAPSFGIVFFTWNRDGSRIVSGRRGGPFWESADGSGRQSPMKWGISTDFPSGAGPDPDSVLVTRVVPETSGDVYLLSLSGAFPPRSLVSTGAYEGGAQLSPDGGWLVFVSDETGQNEVYVSRFRELDRTWQVSEGGGTQPRWAVNGREIYYRNGFVLNAVSFNGGAAEPMLGKPQALFTDAYDLGFGITIANYDVTPDGRFLMLRREPSGGNLRIVLNWTEELKRILASKR